MEEAQCARKALGGKSLERRHCARYLDHLLEVAAAMERDIAARLDHCTGALSEGANKGFHADVVAPQKTGQPDEITNHFPDYNCRRARRSRSIEGRQQDMGRHGKRRFAKRLERAEIDGFELCRSGVAAREPKMSIRLHAP